MTFSYDLASTIGKMRLEIGDNRVEPDGLLPGGRNFENEELTHFYTEEGSNYWRGVARALEAAAAVWSLEPEDYRLGPEQEKQTTADKLAARAAKLRTRYGYADAATGPAHTPAVSGAVRVQVWPTHSPDDEYPGVVYSQEAA